MEERTTIIVWPDGCWCWPDELPGMSHKPADYTEINIADQDLGSETEVDNYVVALLGK